MSQMTLNFSAPPAEDFQLTSPQLASPKVPKTGLNIKVPEPSTHRPTSVAPGESAKDRQYKT